MLKKLLEKGYFPSELPVPFTSSSYAKAMCGSNLPTVKPFTYGTRRPTYNAKCAIYNLARRGKLRRVLSIPNPIAYFHSAKSISDNWTDIDLHYNKSNQSISRPTKDSRRALGWEKGFAQLSDFKLTTRSASKYILKADISNFYPSIYTHSIPWALHSKSIAKNNFSFSANIGNQIDAHIQNCQEKQTKGIPIGTDVSFAISEIIMSSIDEALVKGVGKKYHRYIDDFEFGCKTFQQAETTLSKLQEILEQYELTLNSSKTKILEAPALLDPIWLHELKNFRFRTGKVKQKNDFLHYFDSIMEHLKKSPDDPVVKYAILKSSSRLVYQKNWPTYQSIILQWSLAEPGILPIALDFIRYYESIGFFINKDELKDTLEFMISQHAPLGHTSEVSYAIFGLILFKVDISKNTVNILESIENPFIALLTLDAQQQGLIDKSHLFSLWRSLMVVDELKTSNWLLAYEALMKGWLPAVKGKNYLDSAEGFSYLKSKNVSFYNSKKIQEYIPTDKYWAFKDINADQLKYIIEPSDKAIQSVSYFSG